MTQSPNESVPGETKKRGVPTFIWIMGGCGCLGLTGLIVLILFAIALPSFLNQIGKARGSEARSTLGTINRSQQAFRLEHETFSPSLEKLDIRFSPKYFSYKAVPTNSNLAAFTTATPLDASQSLKSYIGFVFLTNPATSDSIFGTCETNNPSQIPPIPPQPPTSPMEAVVCPPGSSLVVPN